MLGLASGDQLTAELVDGTLVLRPAAKKTKAAATESIRAALPLEPEQDMLRLIDEPSGPENVHPAATGAGEHAPALKRRGRPPKMAAATNHPVVPVTNPIVGIGPAKLIKKSERAPTIAPPEAPPAPAARIRPERISQLVERRPFRNVEVRSLGPGRGHNRSRRQPSGSAVR